MTGLYDTICLGRSCYYCTYGKMSACICVYLWHATCCVIIRTPWARAPAHSVRIISQLSHRYKCKYYCINAIIFTHIILIIELKDYSALHCSAQQRFCVYRLSIHLSVPCIAAVSLHQVILFINIILHFIKYIIYLIKSFIPSIEATINSIRILNVFFTL